MKIKIFVTMGIMALYLITFKFFNNAETLVEGSVAGNQMNDSHLDYIVTLSVFNAFDIFHGMMAALAIGGIAGIWAGDAWRVLKSTFTAVLIVGALSTTADRAWAYAETTDKTEVYTILPNQSAFWVPDVAPATVAGASK